MNEHHPHHDEDDIAQRAIAFLVTMFEKMGLDLAAQVTLDGRFLRVNLSGSDASLLVTGSGAAVKSNALEAIQLLLGRALFAGEGNRTVVVDADGFRDARCSLLEGAADRLAASAIATGKMVAIYGMNAFDRRAIHLRLANHPELATDSEGDGIARTLLVFPAQGQSSGAPSEAPPEDTEIPL